MPRKGPAPRRELTPDPVYRSTLVTQIINKVLLDGKRSLAENTVYSAMDLIAKRTNQDALTVVKKAVEAVRPQIEVRSRRVGGSSYQVPIDVRPRRATTLAIRWIIGYARARREHTMAERVAGELLDASNYTGQSVKRRDDMHKMAEANKAFAHYRW